MKKSNSSESSFQRKILDKINDIIKDIGATEQQLTNMAKDIRAIFKTTADIEDEADKDKSKETRDRKIEIVKKEMVNRYNSYIGSGGNTLGYSQVDELILDDSKNADNELYRSICTYYEYMQFKRGVFKCTGLEYDNSTGRVVEMDFKFTGKIL